MAERAELQKRLKHVEFIRVRFLLEMADAFRWTMARALELRTKMLRASRWASSEDDDPDRFASLFDPPVSKDPAARRRYQKPAPGFVVHLPRDWPQDFQAGDHIPLDVVFWGSSNLLLPSFYQVLESLGRSGLDRRQGRFKIEGCLAADATGRFSPLNPEVPPASWAPPLVPILWWLEAEPLPSEKISLSFHTPLRLMSGGRPMFQCDFLRFFPFLLRRVTSMCHTYCHVDLFDEPGLVIESAGHCRTVRSNLRWEDVRMVPGPDRERGIGGLLGSLDIDLEGNYQILDLLRIGSLLSIGKGSSFGSGGYEIGSR